MRTLLLKFAGPLQSWGTSSHFESRHTDFYPSKSAVIGFVAACLGYRRYEDEKIKALNDLQFAVRVDRPGRLLKDYQTVHKFKKNGNFDRNYVTERYYIEDGIFLVALASENEDWIQEIQEAIQKPYFQPYLGRRSVPPTLDFLVGCQEGDPLEILKAHPWQGRQSRYSQTLGNLSIYFDNSLGKGIGGRMRKDRVQSLSSKNRSYLFREEKRLDIPIEIKGESNQETHDAFEALGGDNVPF